MGAFPAGLGARVPPYLRYVAVSGMALALDMGVFLTLIAGALPATPASALSYLTGTAAHWLLSSRLVFGARLAERGVERQRQQGLFFASALAGLTLTVAVVALGGRLGIDARIAKLLAVGFSFQATYLLRRKIVFA